MYTMNDLLAATSIFELRDMLNQIEADIDEAQRDGDYSINDDLIDYSSLPLFSNNPPANLNEVYSYDDEHILVQAGKWTVDERSDAGQYAGQMSRPIVTK
jgi:hypothetical protein